MLRESNSDKVTVVGAGVTLHEALAAYETLKKEGINIRVVDAFCLKVCACMCCVCVCLRVRVRVNV